MQSNTYLPTFYDSSYIHQLWKNTIVYSVDFDDPIYCYMKDDYTSMTQNLEKQIKSQKNKIISGQFFLLSINFEAFDKAPYKIQKELAAAYKHEVRMFQKVHHRCIKCQSVSTAKEYLNVRCEKKLYHCMQCRQLNTDMFWKKGCDMMLPVWFNEKDEVQFNIPEELKYLRLGEQLLIQRLSCFIPIVHIKNGLMGIHGHCISFRQDVAEICNILPRTRVNAIKIIKSYKNLDSHGIQDFDLFIIRRDVVLKALKWLKTFHKWYRDDPDLIIRESNLDWMGEKESASLIGIDARTNNLIESKEFDNVMRESDENCEHGKI